jgi:hypothetical protein
VFNCADTEMQSWCQENDNIDSFPNKKNPSDTRI